MKRLLLLLALLCTFAGSAQADTRFDDPNMTWISHNPSVKEPWIVINLLIYDNYYKDSFFTHDKTDGHDGPAVYVDGRYICSPDWELAWPGWKNTGNYSDLDSERKNDQWWGSTYGDETCTIRFWNPYRTEHKSTNKKYDDGYYIRVNMYIFLKEWKVGEKHTVKVCGKWKINNISNDNEEMTWTTKVLKDPWEKPTASMSGYEEVSLSGTLPDSLGTTVGAYTQSAKAPSEYLEDQRMFACSKKYGSSTTKFSDLSGNMIRTTYTDVDSLPVQYSATIEIKDFANKHKILQKCIVYNWVTVPVPGFTRPTGLKAETFNQWNKECTISWNPLEKDADGNKLSKAGTWTIRNNTTDKDLATGLSQDKTSRNITLGEYNREEEIQVSFVPKDPRDIAEGLSQTIGASIVPTWSFGAVTAKEVPEGISLKWSHQAIEDASGSNPYTLYIQRSKNSDQLNWENIAKISIENKDTISGSYTDAGNNLESNTSYNYRLKVNIFKKDQLSEVVSAKLGGSKITDFTASRGNYSNMVKLSWTVDQVGATTSNFIIYRRPLGSSEEEDDWMSIYTTSGTQATYSYDDVTALPGSFNDYKIVLWTQDGQEQSISDMQTTDGFSVATGIISGNIAYGTGTAVEGAKVMLKQQNADGDIASGLRSVKMSGFGAGFKYDSSPEELRKLFAGDFSIQMYINPDTTIMADHNSRYLLFDVYKAFTLYMRYDNTKKKYKLGVYVGGINYDTSYFIAADSWTHVACIHNSSNHQTGIYTIGADGVEGGIVYVNQSPLAVSPTIRDDDKCISIGNEASLQGEMYYNGYMDEFRFWTKALTKKDIERNYNHPLSGSESGLAIYYPFDEGLAKQGVAYDFSKKNGISNGRHANTLVPANSSTKLPDEDMMSLMSYTDTDGYYEVRGVPFSGEGTSYSVIPTLGIHEFQPAQQSRFVSMSSLTHSGVDFNDVSSFPVSGKVFYAGTDYPLEGAYLYVDGIICSKDGKIVETNEQGEFTISVPIGDHFITVEKNGHVFTDGGRYPVDPNNVGVKHTFDREIKNLEFYDSTMVNFTGRVVGGDIEGKKDLGFGLSQNNIGITELILTPLNEIPRMNVVKEVTETTYSYETNPDTVGISSASNKIASKSWRGAGADDCRKIFIRTDSLTGEFSAMLPPLEYKIASMKVVKTGLEVGESTTIDLSNPLMVRGDTLRQESSPEESYSYHTKLMQTYHSTPTFLVTDANHDDGAFGISSYTLKDEQGELKINDIYRIGDNGKPEYKYGGAVFEMYDNYTFNIKAYEEYVNSDAKQPVNFRVPLQGLVVTIDNALSAEQAVAGEETTVDSVSYSAGEVVQLKSNQLRLDSLGCACYKWMAGLPNIASPYTRTIAISYDIDDRTYVWNDGGITGIVLGDMPTGNNFVTAGPDMLQMILRDPPGSKSKAEWASGTIKNEVYNYAGTLSAGAFATGTIKLGLNIKSAEGLTVYLVTNTSSKHDIELGLDGRVDFHGDRTYSTTIENTKTISTSDDIEYDGAPGDIFVGTATNVIIGAANNVGFHRVGSSNEVTLDVKESISTGMEFSTMFSYTQNYIENMLMPNLELMRNSMLKTVDKATINEYVNNSDHCVYLTELAPDDPMFGQDSTYTWFVPKTSKKDGYQDSVAWCNDQIKAWEGYLRFNEAEKVSANNNRDNKDSVKCENYSFDAGSTVNKSYEKQRYSSAMHFNVDVNIRFHFSYLTGFTANDDFGFLLNLGFDVAPGFEFDYNYSMTDKTVFNYTLAEEGDDNALTVDVYDYGEYGPIFRTLGGQTSAPYEGKVVTKYYKPGTTIMEPTMQIEVPQIDVDVPVVTDIPSGSTATYTLRLSNASETKELLYYRLGLAEDTNPNGAMLFIDGAPVTDVRTILIEPHQTVTKTLLLKQSDQSILDYDRIGIVFASSSQYYPTYTWDVIADTAFISAHFVPSSSPVTLALSNTTMNTQTGTDLVLTMKDFDRTYRGLKAFRMQYKKQGATDWTQIKEYVLNEADKTSSNELLPATGASVSYTLPMSSWSDGDYLFRIVSASTYGTDEVTRMSEEIALAKDMQRPTPMGVPEPTDGILDIGDELSVTFNETILKGELTKEANFKVTGVLNGAEIDHESALNGSATTDAKINLAGKDFAFDMWVNLAQGAGTLLSHGNGDIKLTIGTDDAGKLLVNIGNKTYTSQNSVPTGKWAFLSLSLTADGILNATVADDANETTLFKNEAADSYEGNGPVQVGCNTTTAMHELLLWDEAHDMTTALLDRSKTKNPSTRHLIGYWKMNEGEGTTIRDYARNRHMTMPEETWYLNNENKAINLDGQSYVSINTSELPTCVDDDYALEFWMRGGEQTGEAQLLQMGDVALSLTAEGNLQLTGKDAYLPDGSQLSTFNSQLSITDNVWHHVALNVLRQGAAAVYVDGKRCLSTASANVGSIATNNLILGAHRTTVSQDFGTYAYDHGFKGQLDEVRVWNATLNADLLSKNRKVRLTGSEDGLVAYYPFEKKTLDSGNQVVTVGDATDLTGSGHQAEVLTLNSQLSTLNYVDNAPALRTKPTETNVSFTYVASNEKVVINIDEDPAIIEGCTLNFTVRDVRDENGNYSVPAIWSAFVNRNELAWDKDELTLTKQVKTESSVTATVINKSGQQQMWTLSGMPSWLTATDEYGTTNPLDETMVTFTISSATPIGKYEETIYLKGNNGIETPLTLSINVTGQIPYWNINPNDYENSMSVIGRVEILGVPVTDEDDIVAAFIDGECRGVAHPAYMERYDSYFVTMDIYGDDDADKEVTFRAYDASTGTLYPAVQPDRTITFTPMLLEGRYETPVVLNALDKIEQSTNLKAGWNWVSFYVKADDMKVSALFDNLMDDVLAIKSFEDGYMYHEHGTWKGNLTGDLENGQMYAVQMKNNGKLHIVGEPVDPAKCPIELKAGWNWVGYYGRNVASVADALANMNPENGDIVKGQSGVTYFNNYEWNGTLVMMEPGLGYVMNVSTNRDFGYPRQNVRALQQEKLGVFQPVDRHAYSGNAIMAVRIVAAGSPLTNTELGVFADEECRTATITDKEGMAYLTIPGEEEAVLTFKVVVDNQVIDATTTVNFQTDGIYGTPMNPLVIDLDEATSIIEHSTLNIEHSVYDLSGRKYNSQLSPVNSQLSPVNSQLKSGVYIINGQKKAVK
ncbi:MAG: hypothetical protein IJR69_05040 [Bacteroidaceae bacterium]|nr:hypothetical protein [Bacteroidaceae bacterium]